MSELPFCTRNTKRYLDADIFILFPQIKEQKMTVIDWRFECSGTIMCIFLHRCAALTCCCVVPCSFIAVPFEAVLFRRVLVSALCCFDLCCSYLCCFTVAFLTVLFCRVLLCSLLFCSLLFCRLLFCRLLFCQRRMNNLKEPHFNMKMRYGIRTLPKEQTSSSEHKCSQRGSFSRNIAVAFNLY